MKTKKIQLQKNHLENWSRNCIVFSEKKFLYCHDKISYFIDNDLNRLYARIIKSGHGFNQDDLQSVFFYRLTNGDEYVHFIKKRLNKIQVVCRKILYYKQ